MSPRRICLVVLAAALLAAFVQRAAMAFDHGGHQLSAATTRRPNQQFFNEQWRHLCTEVKAPDIEHKPLSHAMDRLDRCTRSFSAATANYSDRKRSADTLAHAAHYLQDALAPRGEVGLAFHREMLNQTHGLLNNSRQRASFYATVDRVKSDLKSKDKLGSLLNSTANQQRRIQRGIDDLMWTKGDVTTRDHAEGRYWRYRDASELSPVERGRFDALVTESMATNAAYTERMYELYLEKVDPQGAKNVRFEFDPSGIEAALKDKDVIALINKEPPVVDMPAPGDREAALGELAAEGTGPADVGDDVIVDRPGDVASDETDDTPLDTPDDTSDDESQELKPVIARGGPWSVEVEGGVYTMTQITLYITKDGTAKLSAFQFAAPPLILEADARFAAVDRTKIEVDANQPEIATKVVFNGHLTIKAMTFSQELVQTRRQATCVVWRQADGSWVVDRFGFPRPVVLKPYLP